MMKQLKKKRKGGFTLIELIVVIAILGILAAIAVPRFSGVQSGAQDAANEATERTIKSAVTLVEAHFGVTFDGTVQAHEDKLNEFLDGITIQIGTTAAADVWTVSSNGQNILPPSNQ